MAGDGAALHADGAAPRAVVEVAAVLQAGDRRGRGGQFVHLGEFGPVVGDHPGHHPLAGGRAALGRTGDVGPGGGTVGVGGGGGHQRGQAEERTGGEGRGAVEGELPHVYSLRGRSKAGCAVRFTVGAPL